MIARSPASPLMKIDRRTVITTGTVITTIEQNRRLNFRCCSVRCPQRSRSRAGHGYPLRTADATAVLFRLVLVENRDVLELFALRVSSAHGDGAASAIGGHNNATIGRDLSTFLNREIQCAIIDLRVGAHV